VPVPPSEPGAAGKFLSVSGQHSDKGSAPSFRPVTREEVVLLSSLRDLVASGEYRLEMVLAAIADAARRLTGASGSAIAMWKDGMMVCRARSGETAPALGAELDTKAGISGECLRTGVALLCPDTENNPLVDAEVCRSLGLRSITALPVRGWRGTNGILEVFSRTPGVFSQHHVALLGELAALAERARAFQPHGASQAPAREVEEKPLARGILPASDRVGEFVAAIGGRRRQVVIGAVGVVVLALVVLAVWLGWRGPTQNESRVGTASAASAAAAQRHLPDDDPVWKPNPGGEVVFPSNRKTSAGSPVKLASKMDVIAVDVGQKAAQAGQSPAPNETPNAAPAGAAIAVNANTTLATETAPSPSEPSSAPDAPAISVEDGGPVLNEVLSSKGAVPEFSVPISQGVSGGRLQHRVDPVYPAQARTMRLQGRVRLTATVGEDGRVAELKVVEGAALLADSAVDAVKKWRFQPFLLNGKPIKQETTITIDFKLPSASQ